MAAAQVKPCPSWSFLGISLRVARNPGGVPPGLHTSRARAEPLLRSASAASMSGPPFENRDGRAPSHFLLVFGLPAQQINRVR